MKPQSDLDPEYCSMCQRLTRAEVARRHPDVPIVPPDAGSFDAACPHCTKLRKIPGPGAYWFCACQVCCCPTRPVLELVNTHGFACRVGEPVDVAVSQRRPGIVLALHAGDEPKHHRAIVRYDGDDPTPAHVMAHQLHPRGTARR